MNSQILSILSNLFEPQQKHENYEGLEVLCSNNVGASDDDIALLLAGNKVKVPLDYLTLLKHFNGCFLFQYDDLGGFEFLGTKDIKHATEFQKASYEEDWENSLTIFCRIICDGDFLAFRTYSDGSYNILDCYHDEIPANWKTISTSIDEFIIKLIDSKGQLFWLK